MRNIRNSNAIKYTDKGGLITIRVKKTSREVEVSIEDTGHGMSKEVIQKIFVHLVTL